MTATQPRCCSARGSRSNTTSEARCAHERAHFSEVNQRNDSVQAQYNELNKHIRQ